MNPDPPILLALWTKPIYMLMNTLLHTIYQFYIDLVLPINKKMTKSDSEGLGYV